MSSHEKLPFLLSNPHAGLRIPPEVQSCCILSQKDIVEDGDEGAGEIYDLASYVQECISADIARAIVDLNRSRDDFRPDGVVKTQTCWKVPVYSTYPSKLIIERLLKQYYDPYHQRLRELAGSVRMGVDCHTMAAQAPPIEADHGQERPWVCLSDLNGNSLPRGWMDILHDCFSRQFEGRVRVNHPFQGGYITRSHHHEMPWLQLELTRAPIFSPEQKRSRVLASLQNFWETLRKEES
ncbi:MAG: N-formylglutamate amidohydrolase [Candidatus Omnitrophica bacterium]|nr:N-formylglutamate amidohydrolase [Candidatus Omnitrophota bacterium]